MRFALETKNSYSDKHVGQIDPRNGWPTHHPSLIVEAKSEAEAVAYFEQKYPGNVLAVVNIDASPERKRVNEHRSG